MFPVIFLLLFGTIFGGSGSGSYTLTVQNQDVSAGVPSTMSQNLIRALNSTGVVTIATIPATANVSSYIKNQTGFFGTDPRVLVIPRGFAANVTAGRTANLTYISSPSDQLAPQVGGVVASVAAAFNFQLAGTSPLIGVDPVSSSFRVLTQVDYYVPGLIAAFMMTNGVIGLTNVATEFKRTGLTKRLSSTPLTKMEWLLGNVLSQAVLALLLAAVMIVLAVAIYHSQVSINVYDLGTLFLGAVLFSGIGMALSGIVSDPEAAAGLGNAVAFPMMFLSGTFYPIDIMPPFLQWTAKILPLTYFSNGLRDSMITGDFTSAAANAAITGVLALAFIVIGAWATRWKTD